MTRPTKEQIQQMADRAEARSAGIVDDGDMDAAFNETCDKAVRDHSLEISQAEIARVALLPDLEYRIVERKPTAKRLGIAASVLDKYVEAARPKDDTDNQQGRAVRFADIEPWPNPVDGSTLIAALVAAIKEHVVLLDDQADTIAFWVLHTWLVSDVVTDEKGGAPVCEHCGGPATPDSPVLLCAVDGEEYLLHPDCRADWLGNGAFRSDIEDAREELREREGEKAVCEHCGGVGGGDATPFAYGEHFAEALHPRCRHDWLLAHGADLDLPAILRRSQ